MDNLVVYYINLDNRQDKDIAAKNQLVKTSFPFQRISAIKYSEVVDSEIPYKYFRLVSAVKKSHIKACVAFLESNYEMALILEDDFKLDLPNFRNELLSACNLMKMRRINFLQLGHLSYVESVPSTSIFGATVRHVAEFGFTFLSFLRFPFSPIVTNHIRWGAQAYLIDRQAGLSLVNLVNTQSKSPIDNELRSLCRMKGNEENSFRMARMKKNLIRQNLAFSSDTQGVVGKSPN